MIRHGRTSNNLEQVAQGWADPDLDEVGFHQAEMVANYFESIRLDQIYSSDLKRSVQTATPTSTKQAVSIITSQLLRERSMGELENAPMAELRHAFDTEVRRTGESRFRCSPHGVESAYDVINRVAEFAQSLSTEQGHVAVFTHGMAEECLLCALLGAPVESSRSFNFDNASISTLTWRVDVWQLETYNTTAHLVG